MVCWDLLYYAVGGAGVGVGAVVAAPMVLTVAGFTSSGIAAGSIAASMQGTFIIKTVCFRFILSLKRSNFFIEHLSSVTETTIKSIDRFIAFLNSNVLSPKVRLRSEIDFGGGNGRPPLPTFSVIRPRVDAKVPVYY